MTTPTGTASSLSRPSSATSGAAEEILRTGIVRPDGLFEPVEWGDLSVRTPFVTFDQRFDIYVDELKIELIHLTTRPTPQTTSSLGSPSTECSSAAT